jgi:hypothetical protein
LETVAHATVLHNLLVVGLMTRWATTLSLGDTARVGNPIPDHVETVILPPPQHGIGATCAETLPEALLLLQRKCRHRPRLSNRSWHTPETHRS